MKIGFSLPHMGGIATAENIAYAARFGETEGFDSLWVVDRILWPSEPQTPYPPSPDGSWPEVYQNVIDPIETFDPNSPKSISRSVKRFIGSKENRNNVITAEEFTKELALYAKK